MAIGSNNRYELASVIGRGSQGNIVSGIDTTTNQPVAIKIFHTKTQEGMFGFSNESLAMNKIKSKSKYLCEIMDCFQPSEDVGVIIMKRYQSDLFDYFFGTQTRELATKKQMLKQVCLGVSDLHRNGIAHLDIKPENILVDAEENIVICDFGCSFYDRQLKNSKQNNIFGLKGRGTRTYAAPEVNELESFDPLKADIYSLGVLLHVTITGFFPNVGDLRFAEKAVDGECLSLLRMMLDINPDTRATIDQVLSHPYISVHKKRKSLNKRLPRFLRR